mmetsp:Transcript_30466/g.101281  ORF Transcript_30466/g.101281 Transcript_30466/m.101281 type:complete len:107 (-) Transcript_30466:2276-2596(-)
MPLDGSAVVAPVAMCTRAGTKEPTGVMVQATKEPAREPRDVQGIIEADTTEVPGEPPGTATMEPPATIVGTDVQDTNEVVEAWTWPESRLRAADGLFGLLGLRGAV